MAKSSRGKKLLLLGAAGFVLLLLVALVVAYLLLPGIVLSRIEDEAAARGVKLQQCRLDLGWSALTLTQCQFQVEPAGDIGGTLERVEVTLQDFKPSNVRVVGAEVQVVGSPDFDELFAKHKPRLDDQVPLTVVESSLVWRAQLGSDPQLRLDDVRYRAPEGSFSANVNVSEAAQGKISRKADLVQLDLALVNNPNAKFSARIHQGQATGELRLELQGVPLKDLDNPLLRVPKDLEDVSADLQVYAEIPIGLTPKAPQGDFRVTLRGLNFPVPRELHGLVYGTPVELNGQFTLDRSFTKAQLNNLALSVGALKMRGNGKLALEGVVASFETSLSGNLACDAIVRSAAAAHVDSELAKVAGKIARLTLKGSVALVAYVNGRSDQLDQVQVLKSVGVGCGLKPLPLPGADQLPKELLKRLPKLEDLLPPEGWKPPELKLPKLPFPKRRIRDDGPDAAQPDNTPSPAPPKGAPAAPQPTSGGKP